MDGKRAEVREIHIKPPFKKERFSDRRSTKMTGVEFENG
jgi:hypothetical protein